MRQLLTQAIVLTRTDFQEADRIVTFLTPDQGKVRVLAKGVRRPKSKLAGGIELFSVSDITYLPGRGELCTLISTRLIDHFGNIVTDIERTMFGYEVLKRLNRVMEDAAESDYFTLLRTTLAALNDPTVPLGVVEFWFSLQLLQLMGQGPNLTTDTEGNQLQSGQTYVLDFDAMTFAPQPGGPHTANHIKLLRLGMAAGRPLIIAKVANLDELLPESLQLAKTMLNLHVRV